MYFLNNNLHTIFFRIFHVDDFKSRSNSTEDPFKVIKFKKLKLCILEGVSDLSKWQKNEPK